MKQEKEMNYKELIPKLIQKSKSLSKELKDRIKLNHIFSEFETKASNQFNFFIKESEKRYLYSKYGSKMEYLLKSSQKRGKKEANKILNDNFYLDIDILNERKKMLKKSTNEVHQNITDILNKIRGVKKIISNRNNINLLNTNYLSEKKEKLERYKNEINQVLNKEEESIAKSFDNYKYILSKIKPCPKKNYITDEPEENENNKIKKKMFFNVPRLNLLNYTKALSHFKTNKEIDDENRINIKKLLPYSISGKNLLPKDKKFCYVNPLLNHNNKDLLTMNYTNSIVIQKAMNEYNVFNNYNNKNDEISKKLGIGAMPSLKIYEKMIKNRYNKIKLERKHLNDLICESQKDIGIDSKAILNKKIKDNLNCLTNFEKNFLKYSNTISV